VTVVIVVKVVKQVQEADLKSNQRLDVLKSWTSFCRKWTSKIAGKEKSDEPFESRTSVNRTHFLVFRPRLSIFKILKVWPFSFHM
jgi:hypothetical protein